MTEIPFVHSTRLWDVSIAPSGPLVAFSELPRGRCPVVTGTFTVNYVIEGVERYMIGGREIQVSAGEQLLVEPGTIATASLTDSDTVRGISVYLPTLEGCVPQEDQTLMQGFRLRADQSAFGGIMMRLSNRLMADPMLSAAETKRAVLVASAAFEQTVSGLEARIAKLEGAK